MPKMLQRILSSGTLETMVRQVLPGRGTWLGDNCGKPWETSLSFCLTLPSLKETNIQSSKASAGPFPRQKPSHAWAWGPEGQLRLSLVLCFTCWDICKRAKDEMITSNSNRYLLSTIYPRTWAEQFTTVISFNPHNHSTRDVLEKFLSKIRADVF